MACGCPSGYSLNTVTGLCEQTLNEPFSIGSNVAAIPAICAEEENMIKGTVIYSLITTSQFPLTGQNTPSPSFLDANNATITPASSILTGSLWVGGTTTTGLLNQRGVGLPSTINTWYGASRCITVNSGDTPSFALSAKTAFRLFIDGVLAIIYQPTSGAKANSNLHIFPISLSPGQHTYKAEALCAASYSCGGATTYGSFLVETYNNVTAAILGAITTQSTLNSYYIASNASIPVLTAGANFDTSSNLSFAQFGCPVGYENACFPGSFTCVVTNTSPFVACCYNLTNCSTGAIIKVNVDLSQYLGKTINVVEYSGCFVVSLNNDAQCSGGVSVTVASSNNVFDDCISCALVYYQLTDCNGVAANIVTTTNFSSDVGGIVKLQGYDGICWIPTITSRVSNPISVTKSASYTSCATCLFVPPPPIPIPPFYEIAPVALKNRSVQPGYDEGHCDIRFIEKINCNFSNQVYSKLLTQKYGVKSCIDDEFDKFFIKKQLLDLNLIDDPNFCHSIDNLPPCGVSASITVFNPIYCTAPSSPNANIQQIVVICTAPNGVNSLISYQ